MFGRSGSALKYTGREARRGAQCNPLDPQLKRFATAPSLVCRAIETCASPLHVLPSLAAGQRPARGPLAHPAPAHRHLFLINATGSKPARTMASAASLTRRSAHPAAFQSPPSAPAYPCSFTPLADSCPGKPKAAVSPYSPSPLADCCPGKPAAAASYPPMTCTEVSPAASAPVSCPPSPFEAAPSSHPSIASAGSSFAPPTPSASSYAAAQPSVTASYRSAYASPQPSVTASHSGAYAAAQPPVTASYSSAYAAAQPPVAASYSGAYASLHPSVAYGIPPPAPATQFTYGPPAEDKVQPSGCFNCTPETGAAIGTAIGTTLAVVGLVALEVLRWVIMFA